MFSSKIGNETPLRFVNFGFNYHKAKSFNNNMRMEGNLGLYSQTYLMASQAAGIENGEIRLIRIMVLGGFLFLELMLG